MSFAERARTAARRPGWRIVAALVVLSAAVIGVLVHRSSAVSSSSSTTFIAPPPAPARAAPSTRESPEGDAHGAVGEADGVVPDGVTVFDDEYPAVAKLDPALLRALRQAAGDASHDRVTFYVDSGWRSAQYQEHLLRQAISKYGSEAEAARWVATPKTSAHVSGDAVDIGPTKAATWLSDHGAAYGLCQIYRNEPWHYELRPDAVAHGCPRMYADAAHDPRMQP